MRLGPWAAGTVAQTRPTFFFPLTACQVAFDVIHQIHDAAARPEVGRQVLDVPALDVASRYSELGDALLPLINPALAAKYGLEMTAFVIENVSVPPRGGSGH